MEIVPPKLAVILIANCRSFTFSGVTVVSPRNSPSPPTFVVEKIVPKP